MIYVVFDTFVASFLLCSCFVLMLSCLFYNAVNRYFLPYRRKKARLPRVVQRRYAAKNRWQPGKFPG